MKTHLKQFITLLLLTLVFGLTSFTTKNIAPQNEEVFSCYIYRADLTMAKWNEIAGQHGYTQYVVIDQSAFSGQDHIITSASYSGDWEALMNCIGLPASTESIIIAEDLGGT